MEWTRSCLVANHCQLKSPNQGRELQIFHVCNTLWSFRETEEWMLQLGTQPAMCWGLSIVVPNNAWWWCSDRASGHKPKAGGVSVEADILPQLTEVEKAWRLIESYTQIKGIWRVWPSKDNHAYGVDRLHTQCTHARRFNHNRTRVDWIYIIYELSVYGRIFNFIHIPVLLRARSPS